MGGSSPLKAAEYYEDFDAASQVAIVRRAVAEMEIPSRADWKLRGALSELKRLAALAEVTVASIAVSDAISACAELSAACAMALFGVRDAQRWLDRLRAPQPSRTRLEAIRRKLHTALAALGESLAAQEEPNSRCSQLECSLRVRSLVSDFYGAIPSASQGAASRTWALFVANAELKILLKSIQLMPGFAAQHEQLMALGGRIEEWRLRKPTSGATSRLYSELEGVTGVMSSLSARPEVKRHDARALVELSALLSRPRFDDRMIERVLEVLSALRGMDPALDRLIVALPLDPRGGLASILRRVTELRARALAS